MYLLKHAFVVVALQRLVRQIDAKLFKGIHFDVLESENIQKPNEVALRGSAGSGGAQAQDGVEAVDEGVEDACARERRADARLPRCTRDTPAPRALQSAHTRIPPPARRPRAYHGWQCTYSPPPPPCARTLKGSKTTVRRVPVLGHHPTMVVTPRRHTGNTSVRGSRERSGAAATDRSGSGEAAVIVHRKAAEPPTRVLCSTVSLCFDRTVLAQGGAIIPPPKEC